MLKLKRKLQNFLANYWYLEILVFFIFRPNLFLFKYLYKYKDYRNFNKSVKSLKKSNLRFSSHIQGQESQENILLVAGKNMNIQWLQIWSILGKMYLNVGHKVFALTSKNNVIQNKFLKLFNFNLIFLEKMNINSIILPKELQSEVAALNNFKDIKDYHYKEMPVGKMALSTYSRTHLTGILDLETSESRREVRNWVVYLLKTIFSANKIIVKKKITMLFFTEVFMEEYGSIYYAALKMELNIIRFAGTVRDNAIVVQHLNAESDRTHFSSFSSETWNKLLELPLSDSVLQELNQNFEDRYSNKWFLSYRNQPNTKITSVEDGKKIAGIKTDKKIAIIYSHILYDTLFFNGEDIYKNYADWLVETIKSASKNDNIYWLIKIHPSNLWRGELNSLTEKGKYEELRIIEKEIGKLPEHIGFIYPDTPISPYSWLNIADIGVTTRGTSGIELGALGKLVVTAGTGRYENIGFTVNSNTPQEYEQILQNLHTIDHTNESQNLGKRFAFATFCLKPFTLDFLKPIPRVGKQSISSTDDLVYSLNEFEEMPNSISRFMEWSMKKDEIDFINSWPDQQK